jgi:BirA family transcriptional regulator, biotin operon repressor / biotin---[acetyl-CoA-carboxylase] ligase
MDILNAEILRHELNDCRLANAIHFVPECESTNTVASALADANAPDGTLVVTDFQSAGRGRLGRGWQTPRGTSLLFSILLRPPIPATRAIQVGMAAGLGVSNGIRIATGANVRLKWPNDFLMGGRKMGGMLAEARCEEDMLRFLILGIGINVNFDPSGIQGIPPDATSIFVSVGQETLRATLLKKILAEIEHRYQAVCKGVSLYEAWSRALETVGQNVRIVLPEAAWEGFAEKVEEDGALIIRLRDSSRMRITAGDVLSVRAST